ncbi:MAG: thioredoxin [Hyphomonadaceae bacterium]|nr:thioredoxin [Clostridia bacterium]
MSIASVVHLTKGDFDKTVQDNNVVLVDFWAPWCGPCRMVGPVMDDLAQKYEGKAVIAKVNIDEQGELAAKFGVQSIPTVLLFKDGKLSSNEVGAKSFDAYVAMIDKNI